VAWEVGWGAWRFVELVVGMSKKGYIRAFGTKSVIDLARHPGSLFRRTAEDASADLSRLRRGARMAVAAFLRQRGGPFRQGRLVLCASDTPPVTWERYRFLGGYKTVKSLHSPYDAGYAGPVRGRGAWNVDGGIFAAVSLFAGGEEVELAVPATDVDFLRSAVDWLSQNAP
jgi:hypothetical protein